jgi:hypothetical protein
MSNYEQNTESTNLYPYSSFNFVDVKTNKTLSLRNLDQTNYLEIIRHLFKNYFCFELIQSVKIKTSVGIRDVSNLKYNDLVDSRGTIIYLTQS